MTSEADQAKPGSPGHPKKTMSEVWEEYEKFVGVREHLQAARGVADTSPAGSGAREWVGPIDKLISQLTRKIEPLEKKMADARAKARGVRT